MTGKTELSALIERSLQTDEPPAYVSNTEVRVRGEPLHKPRYWTGRGYPEGRGIGKPAPTDDVRFVNCTFENDGGHIYIDAGDSPFTNLVFENCTMYKATRPSVLMGRNVGPVLFKNLKVNGVVIKNLEQLKHAGAGFDIYVPVKIE